MDRKKWIIAGVAVLGVAGTLIAAKGRGDTPAEPKESPFRLGKVVAEDLQVSVREVGVVDPLNKVEVKSTVSGRVVALHVREGDQVRRGDLLAEVEPDVTQAQSLSRMSQQIWRVEKDFPWKTFTSLKSSPKLCTRS